VFDGERHTRALNHKTVRARCRPRCHQPPPALQAPDVLVYSAVLASSAIPKLLPAVQLMRKTKAGQVEPFTTWGHFWRDGSFEQEIPIEALSVVFASSFFIVSQVNPHIVPFFFDNRFAGQALARGRGWRAGFLSAFLERALKADMRKWLQLVDEFGLMPPIFGTDFSRVFLGVNYGNLTLLPPVRARDYLNLASDPSPHRLQQHYVLTGEKMVWPKLAWIEDRMRVEHALAKAVKALSIKVVSRAETKMLRARGERQQGEPVPT
jgi:hypothetical protein